MHLNYGAIIAAAVAMVFFAAAYYIVLAGARVQLSASATAAHRPSARILAFELLKGVLLASVIGASSI